MSAENFDALMTELLQKRPFELFTVELVGGKRHQIDHPNAVAYTDGVAVFLAPGAKINIFDHNSVLQILISSAAVGA